ncbi:unnamed protein product [Dovyalis caffra]|uniref:non-specific serine/threonine protein kinase n=1 Tax=Dovyalis caffra TaxID=77055 RepID=A0AAV1QN50_9ROSI|nr:unnamed protein product [Dovyalis caffra]
MVPPSQKKSLLSLLSINLKKLTITPPNSNSNTDFDFSDVFGIGPSSASTSNHSHSPSTSASSLRDPLVIHNRSHSFVGPSPRYAPSSSPLPFHQIQEDDDEDIELQVVENQNYDKKRGNTDDDDDDKGQVGSIENNNKNSSKIGPADFEILRLVGKGAFGKVFQVRKKTSSNGEEEEKEGSGDGIYAMKVMRKDPIIKKNHVDYMKAERDILTKVMHPFIVQLRYSFQTKSKLYLILDFINGGHLFFHLYRQGMFSEDQAKVYTAEIVSAVSHLHTCGIAHRDLKPENILLDADGHVILTDFGLAKEFDGSSRSNSMCGTTEYMAPEILLSKGHNKDADWWSIGILLYEMLTGQPPFTHSNRKKLQERIIKEKVKLPPYLSSEAHSLLKGKEPSRRLGSGPGGGDEVKGHKWFQSINWKKLEARELQPKYKPDVSGKDCTANFDQCWTTMPPNDSPAPTPTAGEHFQGTKLGLLLCLHTGPYKIHRVAMSSKHRSNNSLCEKSMKMVVNIIKLSSFSIAKMSLGTPSPPVVTKSLVPGTGSVMVVNEPLLSQIPGSQRSQEPQGSSKPISFVMQPDEGNGSSHVIHKENSVIDGRASDYIRKVHEKNRNDAREMSKLSPYILPPPPRAVK